MTNIGSNLKNFRISYLALDGTFPYGFTFGYINYVMGINIIGGSIWTNRAIYLSNCTKLHEYNRDGIKFIKR